MLRLKSLQLVTSRAELNDIPPGKTLINCINAHSYNTARKDEVFANALTRCDYLLPDGASIVMACRWLKCRCIPKERVAGWDLFVMEMDRLNRKAGEAGRKMRCLFAGSSEKVLSRIRKRCTETYPNLEIGTFSPPFKEVFSEEDNLRMICAINEFHPDLMWIGMTAPKQEKWAFTHWDKLNINCHVGTVGAVFEFFAGTAKRAPLSWQNHSLEWLYRLKQEPRRMWRRYILGNPLFIWHMIEEKIER